MRILAEIISIIARFMHLRKILNPIKRIKASLPRRIYKKILWLLVFLIILAIASVGLFWLDYTGKDNALEGNYPSLKFINYLPKLLDIYYLPFMFGKSSLPAYKLIFDKQYLKDLEDNLPKGQCCNCKPEEADKYIPAKFITGGHEYNVEIKVRGDCWVHWAYTKKSWNIKFDENDTFEGKERIGLIIPSDREYVAEYLNNYRAQKLGLVVPEMKFVTLKINREYYGVYVQQEATSNDVLEKNQQTPASNIYKDKLITDRLFLNPTLWTKDGYDNFSEINNYAELYLLLDLINNASDEKFFSQIPNLVDMDNFYKWEVLSMLAGNYHQDFAHNMQIYFDSAAGKFKFIPQDVGLSTAPPQDIIYNPLATRIIKNPEFIHQKNKVLWEYIRDENNLIDDLKFFDEAYKMIRWPTYRDYKSSYSNFFFDRKTKIRRQRYKELYYQAQDILKETHISSIVDISQNIDSQISYLFPSTKLEFLVNTFSGLTFDEVKIKLKPEVTLNPASLWLYYDTNQNKILDNQDIKITNFELKDERLVTKDFSYDLLTQRDVPESIDYSSEDFTAGTGVLYKPVRLKVTSHNFFVVSDIKNVSPVFDSFKLGLKNAITHQEADDDKIYIDQTTFQYLDDINLSPQEFVISHPQFILSNDNLILPAGSHFFNSNTIIPKSVEQLIIQSGAVLNMASGVSIFSYAPIQAKGSAANPIIIQATNIYNPWGVLAVVNQHDKISQFEYIRISNGSQAYINGIFASGQLALHYSNAYINYSQFSNAQDDDALNIKNSQVQITNSIFKNNSADAIDLDFCTGEIKNNTFLNNKNDAIDISGSQVTIMDNHIKSSGDKGISVGEKSGPLIVNNLIIKNKIGIEVKDLSQAIIINNTIVNNEIGVNEYMKKEIFGPGYAEIYNSIIWNNNQQITLYDDSKIKVNNSLIQGGWDEDDILDVDPQLDSDYRVSNQDVNNILNTNILEKYGLEKYAGLGRN